jgi:protein-S-isoprenylcysteine O-methyltransferase Ste14
MYQWVRHPLYGAEMLFFISFLLANFTARNAVFTLGIFLSLHMRAMAEERLLAQDPVYEDFCRRIRKRYIPYVI